MVAFGMATRGADVQDCHPLGENSGRKKLRQTGNATNAFVALFADGDGLCSLSGDAALAASLT